MPERECIFDIVLVLGFSFIEPSRGISISYYPYSDFEWRTPSRRGPLGLDARSVKTPQTSSSSYCKQNINNGKNSADQKLPICR